MWRRIYVASLAISLSVMAFFSYYSWSWLQSIGQASAAAAGYEYHAEIAWPLLWITTVVLILLGSAALWTTNRSWAMWVTFCYFAIMVVVRFFWLDQAYTQFQNMNNLTGNSFSLGPFLAVILIAVVAAIVFFSQFIVLRVRAKMEPPVYEVSPASEPHE